MPDECERPILYASRVLKKAEHNYAQIEREGLSVVYYIKKLRQFVYGRKFTLVTDHKPLLGLIAEDKPFPSMTAAWLQRWAIVLSTYDYSLRCQSGSSIANVDCMSRLPLPSIKSPVVENEVLMMELTLAPVTSTEVSKYTSHDPVLSQVYECIMKGWSEAATMDGQLKPYFVQNAELAVRDGVVLWGNRVIIPPQLRDQVLEELHQVHPGICRMKALARSYVWWPHMDQAIEGRVGRCHECQVNQRDLSNAPIHPWETPRCPWNRIHVNYAKVKCFSSKLMPTQSGLMCVWSIHQPQL